MLRSRARCNQWRGSRCAVTGTPSFEDFDLGVKGEWTIVPTEQVNWKTGGVLKTIATDGIVKGDVNGQVAPRVPQGVPKTLSIA